MATPKVMKLVDPYTGKMVCKVCGRVHFASIKSGGKLHRGSWQCIDECKLPTKSESQAFHGRLGWVDASEMYINQ